MAKAEKWLKAGTVKKGGHWFYQLYNTETGKTVLKPCPNLDAKSKPKSGKKSKSGATNPTHPTPQKPNQTSKSERKAERRKRQKAVEYALHHKGKKPPKKSDGKPKKPKNPWAKEIRKAHKELAQSARRMNTSPRSEYNGSHGMHSHSTKL